MQLNFKKLGKGEPLIILHGFLGMLDNWASIAKSYANNFTVFIIDQRNHGQSPHSANFNYQILADDIFDFCYANQLFDVNIIGHSMGGKVAMKFAQQNPTLVNKLVVADIAPKYYPVHHQKIFEALFSLNLAEISSRNEAEEILAKKIAEPDVMLFLLKNLYWQKPGKLGWKFNLEVLYNNIENVGEALENIVFDKPTLFIKGGKSKYILNDDEKEIAKLFPNYTIQTIPNAGHWLHAEQPEEFFEKTMAFFTA